MDKKDKVEVQYLLDKHAKGYKQALLLEKQIVSSLDNINKLMTDISTASSSSILSLEEQLEEVILYTRDLLAKFEVIDLTMDGLSVDDIVGSNVSKEIETVLIQHLQTNATHDVWKEERVEFLNKEFRKCQSLAGKQASCQTGHHNLDITLESKLDGVLEQNKIFLECINKANLVLEEMYSCPFNLIMKLKAKRNDYLKAAAKILDKIKTMERELHA
jgi:hypothetical protein